MYEIPSRYHGCPGHLKLKEAEYLYNTPYRLGDGLYGNIGTYKGRSSIHMAGGIIESGINGKLIAVDIKDWGASQRFKNFGVDHTIIHHTEGSVETAKKYVNNTFRCIFIDADHNYEFVKADFEAWSPLLDDDGELAFHDSDEMGLPRFLKELKQTKEWEKIGQVVSLSWWKKI